MNNTGLRRHPIARLVAVLLAVVQLAAYPTLTYAASAASAGSMLATSAYVDKEAKDRALRTAKVQAAMEAVRRRNEASLRAQVAKAVERARMAPKFPSVVSLLNSSAQLKVPVDVERYRTDLAKGDRDKYRIAQLHIWLGEAELAQSKHPRAAEWHFRYVQRIVDPRSQAWGLAGYDNALALLMNGAYNEAARAFQSLFGNPLATGFSRSIASRLARCAQGGVGYHAQRAKAGIPEPPRLDPFCIAAAVAACARHIGLKWDRESITRVCPVTGLGSTTQDALNAAARLGLDGYLITADEDGLKRLPKPIVAYVEHDHFIAVTSADADGVTYLCSDCGPWPGGEVHLTWQQWRMLEAGPYVVISRPDSAEDRHVADALNEPESVRVASVSSAMLQRSNLRIGTISPRVSLRAGFTGTANLLGGHIEKYQNPGLACGFPNIFPAAYPINSCPIDGEPVNLATGTETQTPDPDITVYNPNGPSVVWQRTYFSGRPSAQEMADGENDDSYEDNDFGFGWSQSYAMGVITQSSGGFDHAVFLPDGSKVRFSKPASSGACTVDTPTPFQVNWTSDAGSGYYTIIMPDGTQYVTSDQIAGFDCYELSKVIDRNGNEIDFTYGSTATGCKWPLLTGISDHAGVSLLSINRASGTGNVTSVVDRYGRAVYYQDVTVNNANVPSTGGWPTSYQEVSSVSEIVPSGTSSPPTRLTYGYALYGNSNLGNWQGQYLHTVTEPSPTGSGTSTFTINYSNSYDFVTSTVDGNGNQRVYNTPGSWGYTTVSVEDASNHVAYEYEVAFNVNLGETARYDGWNGTSFTHTIATYGYNFTQNPQRPTSYTDGNNHTWNYMYDTGDTYRRLKEVDSPRGFKTRYYYNASFPFKYYRVTRQSDPNNSGTETVLAQYGYDTNGNMTSVSTPTPGNNTVGLSNPLVTTTFGYDMMGNITSIVSPTNDSGSHPTITYNYTSDPNYGYSQSEALGQPLTVAGNIPGTTTHFRYDARGNTTSIIDARGHETDVAYALGDQPLVRLLPATRQTGNGRSYTQTNYMYAVNYGTNPVYHVVYGPVASEASYDERNNPNPIYPPDNNPPYGPIRKAVYNYDQTERLTSMQAYDPVSLSIFTLTSTTYDADDRTTSVTDGNNHTTTYTYDTTNDRDHLLKVSYPGASGAYDTIQYSNFDADDNVGQRTDGRGRATTYSYSDPESRLTSVNYPTMPATTFSYDAVGRKSKMTDSSGSTSYRYDNRDVPVEKDVTLTGLPPSIALRYSFSNDGSLYALNYHTNGQPVQQGTFWYNYDAIGRLVRLTNPFGELTSWGYRLDNSITHQRLANGAVTTYTVNALDQTTDVANQLNVNGQSTALSSYSQMTHDGVGNLTYEYAAVPTTPGGAVMSAYTGYTRYGYDYQNRLTNELSTRAAGYHNYQAYDTVGNPTTLRSSRTNSFNSDNQLTSFNVPTGSNTSAFVYDGDGNPARYKGDVLTFDDEDRMTSYSRAGKRLMSAYYNELGERVAKISGSSTNGANKTFYVYSGSTIPFLELNSSGVIVAVNTVGFTGLVSRATATTNTFYTFDPQGNVSETLDKNGNVLGKDMFDAFGNRSSTDNSADPYTGFGGKDGYRTDIETGLELLGHRYYDPATGRFVTRDPIGYAGGLDVYGYVGNNPANQSDPNGLCPDGGSGGSGYGVPAAWAGVGDAVNPIKAAQGLGALAWKLPSGEVSLGDLGTGFAHSLNPFENGISDREMGARLTGDFLLFAGGLGLFSKLRTIGAVGEAAVGASQVTVREGVYSFTDLKSGKLYVGQSGNIDARLAQHVASGRLAPNAVSSVQRIEVLGGKTAREVVEQQTIDNNGGIGNLANKVNPIGMRRIGLMGPGYVRP